jgi:hypothetical protein
MVLESRQNRLSKLYSMQSGLCFQVFCELSGKALSSDRFDELVKQHDLSFEGDQALQSPPNPKIGEIELGIGSASFMYCSGDDKRGYETLAQSIFTSTNRDLIKKVRSFYNDDDDMCLSNPILDEIIEKYLPEIEQQFPQRDFENNRRLNIGRIAV